MSIEQLAEKLDVSPAYLGLIERGVRGENPKRKMIMDIAYMFNLSADYILGVDNSVKKKINKESREYEELLCLYKLLDEKPRKQLLSIARVLLK